MSQLNDPASAVGLYSISVREPDVDTLLSWAARSGIPFLHLRGGRRGYDLAARDAATLRRWRDTAAATVPVTGVTADTDLAELLSPQPAVRRRAGEDVQRLADAAHALGARWLRLLARHPLEPTTDTSNLDVVLASTAVPLLVELHDPRWLATAPHAALVRLLGRQPRLRLLADTAQLTRALAQPDGRAGARLEQLAPWVEVLHLSDASDGLAAPGHALVAAHLTRPAETEQRAAGAATVEVAVEWTGPDRRPAAALARYREHTAWWTHRTAHLRAGS